MPKWIAMACRPMGMLKRFVHRCEGIAAVEFALILPLALTLYVGAAVVTDAVSTSSRVDQIAQTIVDIGSKQSTSMQLLSFPAPSNAVTQNYLQQILDGAATMMDPAPQAPLSLTLSAVDVFNLPTWLCCAAKVRWSYTRNGSLRPCDLVLASIDAGKITQGDGFSSLLLPVGTPLIAPLDFLIADVSYNYQPAIQISVLPIRPKFQRTLYMMPRSPGQVIATGLTFPSGTSGGRVCF